MFGLLNRTVPVPLSVTVVPAPPMPTVPLSLVNAYEVVVFAKVTLAGLTPAAWIVTFGFAMPESSNVTMSPSAYVCPVARLVVLVQLGALVSQVAPVPAQVTALAVEDGMPRTESSL